MSGDMVIMDNYVPNVDKAIQEWKAYQKLCGKEGILDETDYQKILVKEKDETGNYVMVEREFKKKSAWQKLSRAFNVETRIVEKEYIRTKTGAIKEAYYCVQATLPNGRSVESDALCSRSEKGKSKLSDHSIISIAKTRATNRAIAELIGAGEVSSEEMTSEFKSSHEEIPVKSVAEIPETVDESHEDTIVEPDEPEEENDTKSGVDFKHEDAPSLINECIDALMQRGRNPTAMTIEMCIKDRCKDDAEYAECIEWLQNIDFGG